MPLIASVLDKKFNLYHGWMFEIRDLVDLMDWWMTLRVPMVEQEFHDAFNCKEFRGFGHGRDHAKEGAVLVALCQTTGRGLMVQAQDFNDRILKGMCKTLEERGCIFVSSRGAYFAPTQDTVVLESREAAKWVLLSERARILKWPNGKHYYAKIGNLDVSVEGRVKWDTRQDAEEAVKRFAGKKALSQMEDKP